MHKVNRRGKITHALIQGFPTQGPLAVCGPRGNFVHAAREVKWFYIIYFAELIINELKYST